MRELLQCLVRHQHVRANEEQIGIIALVGHRNSLVHHARVINIRQIDRITVARVRQLTARSIDDVTRESRLQFAIEELSIGGFMVIKNNNENVTCLHGVFA